jgi:hypothetical protein
MKDYKLKQRNVRASHTLGGFLPKKEKRKKQIKTVQVCCDVLKEFHWVHAQRRVPRCLPVLLFPWRFLLRSAFTGSSSCREQWRADGSVRPQEQATGHEERAEVQVILGIRLG